MSIDFAYLVDHARSVVRHLTDRQLEAEAEHWRREALPGPRTTAFRMACAEERRTRLQRCSPAATSARTDATSPALI